MAAYGEPTSVSVSSSSFSNPCEQLDFSPQFPHMFLSSEQLQYCLEALHELNPKLEDTDLIQREFESLEERSWKESDIETQKENICNVAIDPANVDKNRYPNVLPFDTNYVQTTKGYINASFLKTSEVVHQFIATQGPLSNTSEDFWEMVLEFRCPAIVMLTQLVENEKPKCDDYFPTELHSRREFGSISVITENIIETENSLVLRKLKVEKAELQESSLSVIHIQYLGWPDHGTPKVTSAIREIFRRMYQLPSPKPIVVHCSAGIGRTGTYCTIHATLERILAGDMTALNFDQTVEDFRSQRAGMVQSLDQYKYCYKAVIDELELIRFNA